MSDHSRQQNHEPSSGNSEPKEPKLDRPAAPKEPEPDTDVEAPTYQYLTEGFDPDRITKR